MKSTTNYLKFFFLIIFLFLISCFNTTKKNIESQIIWSNKWFPNNAARLKSGIVIDDKGTLLVVGQNFTTTDSIDHPTTLAKISQDGNMLLYKQIGRTGRNKSNFQKKNSKITFHEDRLIEILKTNDKRVLVFGYKTFEHHSRKLWMIEIDKNLKILKDTVYMNLGVSDIGKMKAFNTSKGWCLVSRNYYEENELSRYRTPIYEFNNDYSCTNTKLNIKATVDGGSLHLQWMNSVIEYDNDLLLCGNAAITSDNIDDDDLKPQGYILRFNRQTKQTKVLQKCEDNMYPMYIHSNGKQFCVIYKYLQKNNNVMKAYQIIILYDLSFKELWRDQQEFEKSASPSFISYDNEQWYTYGTFYNPKGQAFYEIIYATNGKIINRKFSENSLEADFVYELSAQNGYTFRLLTDNGWRIDKIEASK